MNARAAEPSGAVARAALRGALALAILGFVPGLLDPFDAPKAAALRIVGLALLTAAAFEAAMDAMRDGRPGRGAAGAARAPRGDARAAPGAAGSPRFPRAGPRFPTLSAVDLAVLAWVIVALLSTLTSVSPWLSVVGEIEQREGLLTTLALAGLYVGARRSHPDPAHVRGTLRFVRICAALAAAYAMLQMTGLDPLAWAGGSTYPAGVGNALRPFATLGNPNLLGAVLAAALATGVARLARDGADAPLEAPLVILMSIVTVATLSRGAWLAAVAGTAAALAGAVTMGGRGARVRAALTLAAVALPALAWNLWVMHAPVAARLTEDIRGGSLSSPARLEIARGALALWRAHPWLGTGPDTFALGFPAVQTAALWRTEWIGVPAHAHSAALQVLVTLGALGALAGLAWLLLAARAIAVAWRTAPERRDAGNAVAAGLVALACAGAVNPVGLAGAACFVVLAALAAGLPDAPGSRRARGGWGPPAGAAVLCAAIVGWAAARECGALSAAGRSREALDRSTLASGPERSALAGFAVREAARASAMAPAEDELRRLECDADLAFAAGALAGPDPAAADSAAVRAERAARAALGLEPRRASNYQRLANALAMEARVERSGAAADSAGRTHLLRAEALASGARAAFGTARRLAPADALILVDEARAELSLGRAEDALATARAIVALYPDAATGHALEAAALLAEDRRGEARDALRRALAARWEEGSEAEHAAARRFLRALEPADSTR